MRSSQLHCAMKWLFILLFVACIWAAGELFDVAATLAPGNHRTALQLLCAWCVAGALTMLWAAQEARSRQRALGSRRLQAARSAA